MVYVSKCNISHNIKIIGLTLTVAKEDSNNKIFTIRQHKPSQPSLLGRANMYIAHNLTLNQPTTKEK